MTRISTFSANSHGPDPLAARCRVYTAPIDESQIYQMFLAMIHDPAWFDQVRPRIQPEYFDRIYEAHWQLFWHTLCRCRDEYQSFSFHTVYQAVQDEVAVRGATAQVSQEQWASLMDLGDQGIVTSMCNATGVDIARAQVEAILRQFLHERAVVAPLRRIMAEHGPTQGDYPADLDEILAAALERHQGLTVSPRSWKTPAEFRAAAGELVPLCENVFVANRLGIIGGPSKSIKTLMALDMAISSATGTPWLGFDRFRCPTPQRVGYVTCEADQARMMDAHDLMLADRYTRFPERVGAFLPVRFDDTLFDLGNAAEVAALASFVRQGGIQVLFIDPINNFLGSLEPQDTPKLQRAMAVLARQMAVLNCTTILVGHTAGDRTRIQQNRHRDYLELQELAWPGITNSVRQWVTVNKLEEYDDTTHTNQVGLWIGSTGGQAGGRFAVHASEGAQFERWQTVVTPGAARAEANRNTRAQNAGARTRGDENRVLDYIEEHPGATQRAMVRNTTQLSGIGTQRLTVMLPDLVARGLLTARQAEVDGNLATCYTLSAQEEE